MNDIAFLVMDFMAHGPTEFGNQLLNAYLEHTGDYKSLNMMRWYLIHRALVRAKVAAILGGQKSIDDLTTQVDCAAHIALAEKFSQPRPLNLWITHSLSGSGKTSTSHGYVPQRGTIRLRSELERKRLFQITANAPKKPSQRDEIYGPLATEQTYN